MTTEEKGSRLKTTLGLENLKGLGGTLKQIKDIKGTIDEAQQTLAELAKDNSPLGKALARLVEVHGLKALNEDNVNVLEEVRKSMEEELKNKGKTIEELEAKNKELTEDKVISEVTSKLTAELDRRLPKPVSGGNGGGEGKIFKALEDVVADFLNKRLLGGGEGTLTSDQVRNVIKEEVAKVATGGKKPEDMVDDIVNAVTMGDKLREKLGIPDIGAHLLSGQGGDSGLRTDLVKILLEDERERLKIEHEHEAEMQRNKHLGTLAEVAKEHVGDGIAALKVAAEEIKGSAKGTGPGPEELKLCVCGACQTRFGVPPGGDWPTVTCPNPQCGKVYTREEVLGS